MRRLTLKQLLNIRNESIKERDFTKYLNVEPDVLNYLKNMII